MRRFVFSIACLGLLLASTPFCSAQSSAAVFDGQARPLSPSQAFRVDAKRTGDEVQVTFHVARGTYLYRHSLQFSLRGAAGARLNRPEIPAGRVEHDDFFGRVIVFRQDFTVDIPIGGNVSPGPNAQLLVRYQGCADAGICYSPQLVTLSLGSLISPKTERAPRSGSDGQSRLIGSAADDGGATRANRLATGVGSNSLLVTLALYFALGLMLAFTPCVLPMIPILSSMVIGVGANTARAALLAGVYVVSNAFTYMALGLVAAAVGINIQALFQDPTALILFAMIFVVMAAGSFGWINLAVPSPVQNRMHQLGAGRSGIVAIMIMGAVSAALAGPCVAPPLVGALLYISSSGDLVKGGAALFSLGLGMGMPMLAIAIFGVRVLPRRGAWMGEIRVATGFVMLGLAWWFLGRLLSSQVLMAGFGALSASVAIYFFYRSRDGSEWRKRWGRIAAALVFIGISAYAAGAALNNDIDGGTTNLVGDQSLRWTTVNSLPEMRRAISRAAGEGRPALVDVWASWCTSCKEMDHNLWASNHTHALVAEYDPVLIRLDVSQYDGARHRALKQLGVYGPPTVLFYNDRGERKVRATHVGPMNTDQLDEALR